MAKLRMKTGVEIAARATDPWYWGLWNRLPNPDTVLRRLGRDQGVFDQIAYDAHVMGELRSIHAALLEYEWRVIPGEESRAGRRAAELAQAVMARKPSPGMGWSDTAWNMAQAVFRGYAVHEVVWQRDGATLIPAKVIDRSTRRFAFDAESRLRLLTRREPFFGEEVPEKVFLLTRHMPSFDNPYGFAVFSACFWPYVFKHSGYRYFTTFCEKFGIPWPVGKYPAGSDSSRGDELEAALVKMVRDAVAAIPDDTDIEFKGPSISTQGGTPQERLISACNRELSKALTSQTLATEIEGQGSRAASDTHHERERSVHLPVREMVSATLNELFAWIAELNLGPNVVPPTHKFYEESEAREGWAKLYDSARHWLPIPQEEAYERLGVRMPKDGEPLLAGYSESGAPDTTQPVEMTACPGCGETLHFAAGDPDDPFESALDAAIAAVEDGQAVEAIGEDLAKPLIEAANADPQMLLGRLAELYPTMDGESLEDLLSRILFVAEVWGRLSVEADG